MGSGNGTGGGAGGGGRGGRRGAALGAKGGPSSCPPRGYARALLRIQPLAPFLLVPLDVLVLGLRAGEGRRVGAQGATDVLVRGWAPVPERVPAISGRRRTIFPGHRRAAAQLRRRRLLFVVRIGPRSAQGLRRADAQCRCKAGPGPSPMLAHVFFLESPHPRSRPPSLRAAALNSNPSTPPWRPRRPPAVRACQLVAASAAGLRTPTLRPRRRRWAAPARPPRRAAARRRPPRRRQCRAAPPRRRRAPSRGSSEVGTRTPLPRAAVAALPAAAVAPP
jgi:hypothetical protein